MAQGPPAQATPNTAGGPRPFAIKDCALLALATGRRAQNLKELRDHLLAIDSASIYYHFWGSLLEPRLEEREFNNDFAAWARHALHDYKLAERLAVIDPSEFGDLEALRQELLEVIEERLDESEFVPWTRTDQQFEFVHSQIVVFDTRRVLERPEQLAEALPHLSPSSVFYHFIDARRRSHQMSDDFRAWLSGFGDVYQPACDHLQAIDPFFVTLTELRDQLADICLAHFGNAAR